MGPSRCLADQAYGVPIALAVRGQDLDGRRVKGDTAHVVRLGVLFQCALLRLVDVQPRVKRRVGTGSACAIPETDTAGAPEPTIVVTQIGEEVETDGTSTTVTIAPDAEAASPYPPK